MTPQYATSAALLFTEQELGGPCVENESQVNVAATVTQLCLGAGDRVGLVFINIGTQDVYIALSASVASFNGIFLSANGGSVSLTVRDDFTLTSRAWYAVANGGMGSVYVLEVVRFRATPQVTNA